MNRIKYIILCLVVAILLIPTNTYAVDKINFNKPIIVTIDYASDDIVLSGNVFNLYRVASVSEDGEYTPLEQYSKYKEDMQSENGSVLDSLAITLFGIISQQEIKPTEKEITDENGQASFYNIEHGLYVAYTDTYKCPNGDMYYTMPFIVQVPGVVNNEWVYIHTVKPKIKYVAEGGTFSLSVNKTWDDDGFENKRPTTIKVNLLCDGVINDTQELSEANNWRYMWTGLTRDHIWTIVEEEVKPYKQTVTQSGDSAVITNTYPDTPPDVPPDTPPDLPPDTPPYEPPVTPPEVPQTGQLWWPVPFLVIGGLVFIIAGLTNRQKEEKYEK